MVVTNVLKTELDMVLLKCHHEDGVWKSRGVSFVVRGPVSQEKAFTSRRDAETYFSYYVERCRREAGHRHAHAHWRHQPGR